MKVRKNVKRLTQDEKDRFVKAFLNLKDQSQHDSVLMPGMMGRYDDYPMIHMNAMMNNHTWAHRNSNFFPWHRELLYQFEKDLQAIDPDVTIPYWDWTREQSSGDMGFPFKHNFIGVDGTDSASDRVQREAGAPSPYPHAFDPDNWDIVMKDDSSWPDFLLRAFTEFDDGDPADDAPNLPDNDVVVTGTGTTFRSAIGSANYLTLRSRSEDLHNLVHRWVGGNMLGMTSPNDPVFFMHHAEIDRMWSLWQYKNPGATFYDAGPSGTALNSAMTFHAVGDPAPWAGSTTPNNVINGHTMHGDGVWYDTDLPEIQAPAPSLDFVNIPQGLTSYKAVSFKIKGGRQVRFRITGNPTGQFDLTPMGTEFKADPVDADDFYYGYVWVQMASVAGAIPNSSVSIHTYLIDDEGYYAANEGDEYPLGDYTITLTGTSVARDNNAIALVLDRSGSMSSPAGGTSTRSSLLGNAIGVFRTLMLPTDEVSVTTFDDLVEAPIPMQGVNGAPAFSTVDISPRGLTWIGGGIQQGAIELAAATHTNRSMLVLTDGNENIHPYIAELAAGTITNRTYAIGFGLPGEVSDVALNQITANTHGDLVVTGNITTEEQRFELTKYFVQILAGVTNSQVILDPNGKLYFGSHDVIPFAVSDADVYLDAIALCPLPKFLAFVLETPDGKVIKPTTVEPNVQFIMGQNVSCYRMVLPALAADPVGSHGGTWKAHFALRPRAEIAKMMKSKEFAAAEVSPRLSNFLPYSFIVHATSNIRLNAWRLQDSFKPGAVINLYASLSEYDVPLSGRASVWAEIERPDQSRFNRKLNETDPGMYTASFQTSLAGVYKCRVMAEGNSTKGLAFTREKTLTAGVYYGDDHRGTGSDPGELICRLLHCVFEEHEVLKSTAVKRLAELGFDMKRFIDCIEEVCPELPQESIPGIRHKLTEAFMVRPQLVKSLKFANAVESRPIKVKPILGAKAMTDMLRKPAPETMFLPLDLEAEEKPAAGKRVKPKAKKKPDSRHHKK
jgi:hypothetical protein